MEVLASRCRTLNWFRACRTTEMGALSAPGLRTSTWTLVSPAPGSAFMALK